MRIYVREGEVTSPNFTVKICDNNPHRWYISFSRSKPFSMDYIREVLEKENYSTLATTPSIAVFRGKDVKLTWHSQGLIQIDYYAKEVQKKRHVITFVQSVIDKLDFL